MQRNDASSVQDWFSVLPREHIFLNVDEWAESTRYLPRSVTPKPGKFSFDNFPYLREICNLMSLDSPVSEFDFMKGAQIGATVGILENAIGYYIEHVKSSPIMLLTADSELAKIRLDQNILPMLDHSGMSHLIKSSDEFNKRKTGRTSKKIEFEGGGFLLPFGAKNADKLRSVSIRYLLEDEVDSYAEIVGRDGDPQKIAEARTKAYERIRKIARISTPLIKQSSKIYKGYLAGDQRKYFVPCKHCGEMQVLRFQGKDDETGQAFGMVWNTEDSILDYDSVRYLCEFCGGDHINSDKTNMLSLGEWRPTSKPTRRGHRSYHLSGLYSPVGFYSWESAVADWLSCWDTGRNIPKDAGLLQEFYNNCLGEPYEIKGSKIRFQSVSGHRVVEYRLGEIPNTFAKENSGSEILFLTCQVDVHKNNLAVSVMGWTINARCYVIDYWRFETEGEGDECTELSSSVWYRLRDLIENKVYEADDGSTYRLLITLIDAGYSNDTVTTFCSDYGSGVYPIIGRDRPAKNQTIKEFAEFTTQAKTIGFRILVDHYKDRMAPVLRREWHSELGTQPPFHFNAPVDISDSCLKELTKEDRRERRDNKGNVSYFWYRPGNASNELWDLLGYGHAAVEIFAYNLCIKHFELETLDWGDFWEFCQDPENDNTFARTLS